MTSENETEVMVLVPGVEPPGHIEEWESITVDLPPSIETLVVVLSPYTRASPLFVSVTDTVTPPKVSMAADAFVSVIDRAVLSPTLMLSLPLEVLTLSAVRLAHVLKSCGSMSPIPSRVLILSVVMPVMVADGGRFITPLWPKSLMFRVFFWPAPVMLSKALRVAASPPASTPLVSSRMALKVLLPRPPVKLSMPVVSVNVASLLPRVMAETAACTDG